MHLLHTYIPQDRLRSLVQGQPLPDRTSGSAFFADVSGFTPLTEKITREMGARRGIEEVTRRINQVYEEIIDLVERFEGSVVSFAGDSITCWFDASIGDHAQQAVECAEAIQQITQNHQEIAVKISICSGPVRRFVVGDPSIRLIDTLAGATISRLPTAEQLAKPEEIVLDQATAELAQLTNLRFRLSETDQRFYIIDAFPTSENHTINNYKSAVERPVVTINTEHLKPWILPIVYERELAGHELMLVELRPATALFVRFTGLDYDNDPRAQEKLNALVTGTQGIMNKHEGILLELTIGDKGSYLYASFGALHVHENDSERAIQAALEVKGLFQSHDFPDTVQIGVSSGMMRVGGYGSSTRQSFSALGNGVNLAARLMMNAGEGEILISGRVQKSIQGKFVIEARPPTLIKGRSEPILVFAILGIQQPRAIRLREPAYPLPMIGRLDELHLISEKIESALTGHGQIIGISGEAGMGKSRLVAEGIRLAQRKQMVGFGGACQSDGSHTPYLVWNAIWNAFFDLDAAMPLKRQIRYLESEIKDKIPEHLDALPLLGSVLGLPIPDNSFTQALQPADRKAQLEILLVKYLELTAREEGGGLLLVLEDLQWIDQISLDLLTNIARAVEKLPILILLTFRTPDKDSSMNPLAAVEVLNHLTKIELAELNQAESEQAIWAKLAHLFPEHKGGVPQNLIGLISGRAQGNPFYMEELLNFIHDHGIDPLDGKALNNVELPTSLHSLILSRIDQLNVSQQLTLKVASVIGRVFRFDHLLGYYPSLNPAGQLHSDLRVLERLDLTPLESPEPDLTYLFKHLVTHEVGYESISFSMRAQLHGKYANYLETTYPDQIDKMAPQLAHHFDLAELSDQARYYLGLSGDQAAAKYANEEALKYFNRALELTPDKEKRFRFDTLMKRERIYDLLGHRSEQREGLTELDRLSLSFDDSKNLRAQIALRKAKLEIYESNYSAAKIATQFVVNSVNADDPADPKAPELVVDALLLEARAMFLEGQAVSARPQLDLALEMAHTFHYVRGEYNALAQLGLWNWYNGDNQKAINLMEQSIALIRSAGDIRRESEILNNLGIVSKDMLNFAAALGFYEKAQEIAKKIGDKSGVASLLTNMGRASLIAGEFEKAISYCKEAAELAGSIKETSVQGLALHNLSETYRELGKYEAARDAAQASLNLVRSAGYRVGEANTLENLALVEFSMGSKKQALILAEEALKITRSIAARRVEISVMTRVGLILLEMGQAEAAEESLVTARQLEEEFNESIPIFELQGALAKILLVRGDAKSLEQAASMLANLSDEILHEPPTEQSHILPLWLYLLCMRVLSACSDARAPLLLRRALMELKQRSEKISDPILRLSYLDVPENRAIADMEPARLT